MGVPQAQSPYRRAVTWKEPCSVTSNGRGAVKHTLAPAQTSCWSDPGGLEGTQPLLPGACVGMELGQPLPVLSGHDFNRESVLGMFSPGKPQPAEQDLGSSG